MAFEAYGLQELTDFGLENHQHGNYPHSDYIAQNGGQELHVQGIGYNPYEIDYDYAADDVHGIRAAGHSIDIVHQ